jgi:hypothetical protein
MKYPRIRINGAVVLIHLNRKSARVWGGFRSPYNIHPSLFSLVFFPVLRIRDIYRGSRIHGQRFPDPGGSASASASKNLRILTQKSSRKYDPGCSCSLIFYPSWIPDPGIKKAPDPGLATLLFTSCSVMLCRLTKKNLTYRISRPLLSR